MYLENSIKVSARKHSKNQQTVSVSIKRDDQQLPSTLDSFYASESNKEALQMHYIKWASTKCMGEKPLYLGGSLTGDICGCVKIVKNTLYQI